uniref:ATP synthase complex subunit 8 n=1 Tax=Ruidocollaris convexipennis TaxID=2708008 RepID=A0A6G6A656_9ORTH|nr:ATP synthase F0 subunit 8 [Ruidocollaris convexipennis]QID03775.1 ATP synthase F0 subunit 8 [Ruidocollaris convexipennis]
MPQMSPLWWLPLFCFFSFILILFSSFNYFITINQPSKTKSTSLLIKSQLLNWKW